MNEPFNLERFLDAQDPMFHEVCTELRNGRKRGHWMWFVFPQIEGLGHSALARKYAISGLPEAEAYLNHATLGANLRECTSLVNAVERRPILEIFGDPDYLKFRSCMTLFDNVPGRDPIFQHALKTYFNGEPDLLTLARLQNLK